MAEPGINGTVLSVDPATGVIHWSASVLYPKLNMVTADGNLIFEHYQSIIANQLSIADPTGQISPVLAPSGGTNLPISFAGDEVTGYWTLGTWNVQLTYGSFAAVSSSALDSSEYGYAFSSGNPEKQTTSKTPTFHTIITVPITSDPLSPEIYSAQFQNSIGSNAHSTFSLKSKATYKDFTEQISKTMTGLAFIGHSFNLGGTSVGPCFSTSEPNYISHCVVQEESRSLFDPQTSPSIKPEFVDKFKTNSRIIFIGSCNTQEAFKKLWDIDETTKKRALIMPDTDFVLHTDLQGAAGTWLVIAYNLSIGYSVAEAVAFGNQNAATFGYLNRWKVIGDGNVRVAPRKY